MAKKAKKTNQVKETWNTITGTMRIFGNEIEYKKNGKKQTFTKYSVSVGIKNEDDEWINYYIDVKFSKNCKNAPEGKGQHVIEVKNAFFSCESYEDKNGDDVKKLVLVVTDCECEDDDELPM